MGHLHDELRDYSTRKFHETLAATYRICPDTLGNPQVGVEIRKLGFGSTIGTSYIADMDCLDAAVMRAEEFARNPANTQIQEILPINGKQHDMSCAVWNNSVVVSLQHQTASGERQGIWVELNDLRAIVNEGHKVEQEVGCKKDHYIVFNAHSVSRDDHGQVRTIVAKSIQGLDNALNALRSTQDALYEKPQRYQQASGSPLLLDPGATVRHFAKHESQTVAQCERQATQFRERISDHCLIARWCDSSPPKLGQQVTWSGPGIAYNGDFEDFKATSRASSSLKPSVDPCWVLLRKDSGVVLAEASTKEPLVPKLEVATREIQQSKYQDLSQEYFNINR